jgi:endonuclease-3
MNKQQRYLVFQRFQEKNPAPTTELNYSSVFELLISVILSAQATDVSVNKATQKLYKKYNTPEKIFNLGEAELKNHIKTIGLYNSKAKNIILTCEKLIKEHNSIVPDNRASLEAFPGVGRKTANVILNTAFNQPTIAVDTHIFRLSNRLGLAPGKNVLEVELNLNKNVPPEFLKNAHHWLILHGRYICTARNPKCEQCFLTDLCDYYKKLK